jgi:signal transduction histidine kinase
VETLYSPQGRAERLVAAGRTVLATSSLFAVWLDPTEPGKHASIAYTLLVAYVAYSAALAIVIWKARDPGGRVRGVTHAVDLCFFSLFVYFTAGPASPFTTYFVFSMVCATLRWQWRGVLWTALASIAAYIGIGIFLAAEPFAAHVEAYQIVVRVVYLVVIAVLLGYLGAHEERTRREISALAAWPELTAASLEPVLRALLEQATGVIGAPRALLVWMEGEEPWQYFASWQLGDFTWGREAPASDDTSLAVEVAETSFLAATDEDPPTVLIRAHGGFERWRGSPIREPLRSKTGSGPALGLRLRSASFEGHLLILGKRGMSSDDLLLGEAIAALVAARLESVYLARHLAERAATEERIRLARDLHDGALQSLTGFGLRLEAVRRMLADPSGVAPATATIEELQHLLALEQRDLRFFIHELEPSKPTASGQPPPLRLQVTELARRLELEWGLKVELAIEGGNGEIPDRLAREIYHIAREAMVNAVRHGKASLVETSIHAVADPVTIVVEDNGRGFPFVGRLTQAEMAETGQGPRTLRDRVTALDGTLELMSSPSGARLEIVLPLREAS